MDDTFLHSAEHGFNDIEELGGGRQRNKFDDWANCSAVNSLDEGFEETLTPRRLGLFRELGISFKTTNCIESLMVLIGETTNKVDYWRKSDQKHRWLAAAPLDIEPRLRRIKSYRHLPQLRKALQREIEKGGLKQTSGGRQLDELNRSHCQISTKKGIDSI